MERQQQQQQQQSINHLIHPYSQQQQSQDHQTPVDQMASPRSPPSASVRYKECLKNHAAKMGGHVTDGCGEFMPNGEEGCGPDYFKCAACGCHRNFHRKESAGFGNRHLASTGNAAADRMFSPSPSHRPTVMMAFGNGAESSSEDRDLMFQSDGQVIPSSGSQKKRFRTKFTQQQKEEMTKFAEKIRWMIQKEDEQEIIQFCTRVGVKRQVFKVWMHNNKQAMKRRKKEQPEL